MVWLYPMVKNLTIYLFGLTEHINVTDGQTDGQTPHNGIGRAYIHSIEQQKNLRLGQYLAACAPCTPELPLSSTPSNRRKGTNHASLSVRSRDVTRKTQCMTGRTTSWPDD